MERRTSCSTLKALQLGCQWTGQCKGWDRSAAVASESERFRPLFNHVTPWCACKPDMFNYYYSHASPPSLSSAPYLKFPFVSPQKPYLGRYLHRPLPPPRAVKTLAHAMPRQSSPHSGPRIAGVAAADFGTFFPLSYIFHTTPLSWNVRPPLSFPFLPSHRTRDDAPPSPYA